MPGLKEMVQSKENKNLVSSTLSQKILSRQTNPSQHTIFLGLHTGGSTC